jgi:hypothetical protein
VENTGLDLTEGADVESIPTDGECIAIAERGIRATRQGAAMGVVGVAKHHIVLITGSRNSCALERDTEKYNEGGLNCHLDLSWLVEF